MTAEMKRKFEEKFCNIEYDCLTGQKIVCIKYLYSDQGDYLWNWFESKLKEAKIEELWKVLEMDSGNIESEIYARMNQLKEIK